MDYTDVAGCEREESRFLSCLTTVYSNLLLLEKWQKDDKTPLSGCVCELA